MAIKLLENLLINKEEWELAPFKFNVTQLNFNGGSSPTPPTPTFADLGKLFISATPVTNNNYHQADGSLLTATNYAEFVNYIAELYDSGEYTDLFTTEADWQSAVSTYGVCGQYVYDSEYNTVRLARYGNNYYYYIKVK